MKFLSKEELSKMSKEKLLEHIFSLYSEIEKLNRELDKPLFLLKEFRKSVLLLNEEKERTELSEKKEKDELEGAKAFLKLLESS